MSLEEPFDKPVDQGGGRGGETREGWVIRMEPGAGGGKGFAGLSTLRNGDGDAEEDRGGHGGAARRPAAHLEAYLKDSSSKPVGKRKRRKKNRSSTKGNLTIVDAEEGTAIPVATMDSGYGDEDVNDELGPVVVNAEEVERDEALRKRRTIARSNQRWQTVTTAAASTPSAVPAGGSRSRSPSPGTGTGLGGRHDTDTDTDDDDDGGSDLEVARRPRVRYDSPDSSDVDVERRGGGSGAKGSGSSDDGGSDSDSDMDVRRRGRASSTSSEGRGGGGRDLNPGPSAGGMTDGTSTGLVSSKALAQELERKRQEKLRKFAEMDPSVSGRAAETVYRDRDTGARVTKSELEQKEESRRQQEREKPMWSAGLAQKRRRVRELRETYGHGEPSST